MTEVTFNFNKTIEEYSRKRPLYEQLTSKVNLLINDLLRLNSIKVHSVESRTKEVQNFRDKLMLKSAQYKNPLSEITDLSGVRIITYYQDDVEKIGEIINREFRVDVANSVDKGKLMGPNEFGYQSVHYVVLLSDARAGLPEWASFKNLKMEIQVRSVLQHAWASISHALQYKAEQDIPSELRRRLYRLAGIFELADEEFLVIREEHEKLKRKINIQQSFEDSEIEINIMSLSKYVSDSDLINTIFSYALIAGFKDISEVEPKDETEDYSSIVALTNQLGIKTIKQLNDILKKYESICIDYFNSMASKTSSEWYVSKSFTILLILILADTKTITNNKILEKIGWNSEIIDRIVQTAETF